MKDNKLIELIMFVQETEKLGLLDNFIRLEAKRSKKKIINRLDLNLWVYLHLYMMSSKPNKELLIDRIDRVIFGRSTVQRRRRAFLNLTQVIRKFLILEELKEDTLLEEWLYWKAIKQTDLKEFRKQNKSINEILASSNLSKSSTSHQFIAFDFYKEQYNQDCLDTSTPSNQNLINAYCALNLIFEQNKAVFQTEFENRKRILKEEIDISTLTYSENIDYEELIASIDAIPNDIGAEEFIIPYIDFLNDKEVDLTKKNDIIQFLLNKTYEIYVSGNSQPIKHFWDIYFNFCIENKIFYNGKYFNIRHYSNILSLLSGFAKKKVADFINNYEPFLSEKDAPVGQQFGRIFEAYNNKNYNKIINTLSTEEVSYGRHSDLKIRYYIFKTKAHFEVYFTNGEVYIKKQLDATLKYFSAFLSTKVELNALRVRNENFIKWVRILSKEVTKTELLQYKQEVEKDTVHTQWLIEKIKQKIERIQ
ncbi:MAG: hypothetical protein AB8G11_24820 [Saprospiraceae bacterium]